jgi:hypothetical protein
MNSYALDFTTYYNPGRDSIKLLRDGKIIAAFYDEDAAKRMLNAVRRKGNDDVQVHVGRNDKQKFEAMGLEFQSAVFSSITDAEKFITYIASNDPEGVAAGEYYVDAPEGTV